MRRDSDAPLAIVDKRRVDVDVSEVMHLIGDVRGRSTLIVDDIIDTAGTLVKTAEALLQGRRDAGFRGLHASGAFGAGGRADQQVVHQGSGGDRFGAAERSGARIEKIQSAECGGFAGAGHSIDSRRDFDQRIVHLSLCGDRCSMS